MSDVFEVHNNCNSLQTLSFVNIKGTANSLGTICTVQ